MSEFRQRVARSRAASLAAFPGRVGTVAKHDVRVLHSSWSWLWRSREHTNFTYDLTERNQKHLAWWISSLTGDSIDVIRGYLDELESDADVRRHVTSMVARSPRRRVADPEVRYGRRAGWYALVRALRPEHVVETGTDKGLGTVVLAAALCANGAGRVTTIDVNPDSGYLIGGRYGGVVDRVVGDSVRVIRALERPIDMFLHDSLHTYEHETNELSAVEPLLSHRAVVVSDNAHATDALMDWAEATGRRFAFFREVPEAHWYPGAGIGVAR